MNKFKFVHEFELRASPKVLFPYLSTASGLQQWFASKVNHKDDHQLDFIWDGESHLARITSLRTNKSVRFDFMNTGESGRDTNFLEFKLEVSELTNSTFLKVTDYSTNSDAEELIELWEGLLDTLKEIVGS
ncbi:MAG: START-like domain-containing protein [Spirosomataceae bacterium]